MPAGKRSWSLYFMENNILSYHQEYLNFHRTFKKSVPNTIKWHKNILNEYLSVFPKTDILTISRQDAQQFVYHLNNKWLRLESIKNKIRSLKAFYNWLIDIRDVEWLSKNPFNKLLLPWKDAPIVRYLLESEVDDLFKKLESSDKFYSEFIKRRAILILSWAYRQGLRRSEIRNIKFSDIDFCDRTIKIGEINNTWIIYDNLKNIDNKDLQKNKRVSLMPIHPHVLFDLNRYLEEYKKLAYEKEFLIVSSWWKRLGENTYKRLILFIRSEISPNFKGFHSLRHSCGTTLRRRGINLEDISDYLRHSSTKVTKDHYADILPQDLAWIGRNLN